MARRPLVVLLIAAAVSSAFAADDFYEQQLRAAKSDWAANRTAQAADELRIAAFGFLDRPPLLQEALVRLAVAQDALGLTTERSRTIERFMAIEQRFPSYRSVDVEPQIRSTFEKLLTGQVPRATLLAVPSLAPVANYEIRKVAELPENRRLAAYQAGMQREPKNVEWPLAAAREFSVKENHGEVIRWGTRALEIDNTNKEARALVAHARAARRECREALALITAADIKDRPDLTADQAVCFAQLGRYKEAQAALANVPERMRRRPDVQRAAEAVSKNIETSASSAQVSTPVSTKPAPLINRPAVPTSAPRPTAAEVLDVTHRLVRDGKPLEALSRLRPAVEAEPDNRVLRLNLLEAAVLSRDWKTAVAQVPRITPLAVGEELYMFYSSVALYENGQKEEARPLMERARAHMVPSPIVDHYVRRILGETG